MQTHPDPLSGDPPGPAGAGAGEPPFPPPPPLDAGPPGGPAADPARRPLGVLRVLVEPTLVLILGFLLTTAATLPLIGLSFTEIGREAGFNPAELFATDSPKMLWILAIQASIFTLLGWAMIHWRIDRGPGISSTSPRDYPSPSATNAVPRRAPVGPLSTVLLGLGGGVAAVVFSSLASVLLEALGFPVEEQPWVAELLREPGAVMRLAPWIVLVVPVSEEVFFRGYLFRFVRDRAGLAAGIVFSSMVFAAVHMNPSGTVLYAIIAVVLGWAYHLSGRLATPILAHAVLNGFVLAAGVLASEVGA